MYCNNRLFLNTTKLKKCTIGKNRYKKVVIGKSILRLQQKNQRAQHNSDYIVTYLTIIHLKTNLINIFCLKSVDKKIFLLNLDTGNQDTVALSPKKGKSGCSENSKNSSENRHNEKAGLHKKACSKKIKNNIRTERQ